MAHAFKSKATLLEKGMQVKTETRQFTVMLDEPADLGGTDVAMNPLEALLGALGACQAIVARSFAKAHDVKFEEFHVELEGDWDMNGFMKTPADGHGFTEIRCKMHFKSDEPQEKLEKFAHFIEATCPVGASLTKGVKIVNTGVVKS